MAAQPRRPKRAGGCVGTAGRRGSGLGALRALICRGRSGRGHCVDSSHVRGGEAGRQGSLGGGWPGPRGERESMGVGCVAQPGIMQLDSSYPGGGEGTGTSPGLKLWQDWAGLPHRPLPLPHASCPSLLGRALPEPTSLGAPPSPTLTPTPTPIPTSPAQNWHRRRPLFLSNL